MLLSEIKQNPNNPRIIRDDKFKRLCKSIEEFPKMMELRPMVVNSDMIVLGGNMRLKALKELGFSEIPDNWVKRADELTDEEIRRFIILDNASFGEWEFDLLMSDWSREELTDWGVDVPEYLEKIDKAQDGEEIEIPQSVQIEPPKEYILIMAEPNSEDWEELKLMLKLKMVRRGGYKKGSEFDAVALERVLEFKEFKERIKNADSNTK